MRNFKNKYCGINRKPSKGFTLMELILVIIILGIMSVGISGFISLSTQTYMNATNRDELVGNARFVIERLHRELRNALPNSVRVKDWSGRIQCIQFVPIIASTVYTDIPVSPEPASKTLHVIPFNDDKNGPYQCDSAASCTAFVSVYPLGNDDVYADYTGPTGKLFRVDNIDTSVAAGEPWEINLLNVSKVHFDEDSPTQRLYLVKEQISYCAVPVPQADSLTLIRFEEDMTEGEQGYPSGATRHYMAGYLDDFSSDSSELPFNVLPATLQRNAVVQIHLKFTKEDESYVFDHEVHINNVP